MNKQPFIRRGTRSNATARRLIAASLQIAPSVLRSTVANSDIHQPVMRCLALEDSVQAGVHIYAGQHFYQIASQKFPGRFFILVRAAGDWKCSSADEVVRQRCIRQVEQYRRQLLQKCAA